jgi:hypothetical protein
MPLATSEHILPGYLRAWFVASIASGTLAPTVAELTGGTELTTEDGGLLPDGLDGFRYVSQFVEKKIMKDNIRLKKPGADQLEDATLKFNSHPSTPESTKKTALAKGADGYIVIAKDGTAGANPAAGEKVAVWPGTSAGPVDTYAGGYDELASWECGWGGSKRPVQSIAILA